MKSTAILSLRILFILGTLICFSGCVRITAPPEGDKFYVIESIHEVADDVLIRTGYYDQKERTLKEDYWKLDRDADKVIPIKNSHGRSMVAISEEASLDALAYRSPKGIEIDYPGEPERDVACNLGSVGGFKLLVNARFTFLIFSAEIVQLDRDGNEFGRYKLPERDENWPELPACMGVTDTEILFAYNGGEWGGALFVSNIAADGSLSEIRKSGPVPCAMVIKESGAIYLAKDGWHFFYPIAALDKYENGVFKRIIYEEGDRWEKTIRERDGELTLEYGGSICGLTLSDEGELILITNTSGIFSLSEKNTLNHLWEGELNLFYMLKSGTGIGSSPMGVVNSKDDLFVATRSHGLLFFEKNSRGKYLFRKQYFISE